MTGPLSCTVRFPTHTEPGSGLWDAWVLKGLGHSLYFKTHLLKAPRDFLVPNYLSISQSLLNLLSQCLCETKRRVLVFHQPIGALVLEQNFPALEGQTSPSEWDSYC